MNQVRKLDTRSYLMFKEMPSGGFLTEKDQTAILVGNSLQFLP